MNHHTSQSPRSWPVGMVYSFCRDRDLDFTSAVNAAWATVLWGYTGKELIDFPSQTIINDTPTWTSCEVPIDSSSTFSSLLHSAKCTSQVSAPNTDLTQNPPLLNTVTVFTNGGLFCIAPVGATYATGLVCNLSETTIDCAVHFLPGMIDAKQAGRLASAFAHIMDLILSGIDANLSSIDIVSDHDKAELWAWNNSQCPETVNSCAHILFQRRVLQQPNALAVEAWDGSFTYESLDRISTLIAHHLVAQGVGPESAVPLCFDKSCWAIAALLGVIKAGGAMVFIDPANPENRRREIISQINNDFVLTNLNHAASWESMGVRPVIIDENLISCLRQAGASPRTGVTPDSLLYIIFTSGTTSKPKGCLITHKAFLSGALQHAAKSNLGPRSRVMQLASYSFDVSVLEILTSLISGACVCTPDSAAMTQGLASIINSYQITWAFLTPSLVKLVEPYEVPSLQTLIIGGEKLHKADIQKWAGQIQLINGYGPSECSIAAAGDPHLTPESDPANIGRSVGGLAWIVQSDDHDKLVPIGAVGELLISGPILARGYLNNPEQTERAFIDNPVWTQSFPKGAAHVNRFYKTGDLAKFNSDGTIHFIGRKDTQVKLRGMRIELGEIEHSIALHQHVKHVAVIFPKEGICNEKLVAVLSLHAFSHDAQAGANIAINALTNPDAMAQLDLVRKDLAKSVPEYMIPAIWVIIESWPLLTSAKLNRKSVQEWLLGMNDDFYRRLLGVSDNRIGDGHASSAELKLRNIIGRALNMPADLIPPDKSFLGLGGDSITAMQIMAQCRNEGFCLTAKDILLSNTVSELVLCARQVAVSSFSKEEEFNHSFQLSPVQRLYSNKLRSVHEELPEVHFNQSFFIRIAKPVSRSVIKAGLDAIVARHSMLRARFTRSATWTQKVLSSEESSYRFKCHRLRSLENAGPVAMIAQRTLGLAGPVFSADLFELEEQQYLFMVAHHAVIDWFSWRIILSDLETFIATGALGGESPMPFQNWINLQADHAAEHGDPDKVLPFEVPSPDFEFWDMVGKPNTLCDTNTVTFNLSKTLTAQLLGGEPHRALRTEVLDFLIGSLLYSFSQIFTDRALPGIVREGHGREPWDPSLDLSNTVGWFTTMYPLAIDGDSTDDMVSMLKKVKDARHRVPDNGRPYFASRFHNEQAAQKFQDHDLIEIAFDYLGQFQALEREDAILRQEPRPSFLPQSDDAGENLDRLCLIEITAEVLDGHMQYTFVYNKYMKHQDRIQAWAASTEQSLGSMVAQMLTAPLDFTLSDFPLLSVTYEGMNKLLKERLAITTSEGLENIEEIYPCSPMQNGLLFSQSVSSDGVYEHRHQIEVTPSDSRQFIDPERLAGAWARVVQRHSALRTIFIDSSSQDGVFDQIVLKSVTADVVITSCSMDELESVFKSQKQISYRSSTPPHRLTIARVAPTKLICELEINHAIVDGSSIANIVRDICQAYEGSLAIKPSFRFSDYISFIQNQDLATSIGFWKSYLEGQTSSLFPSLAQLEGPVREKEVMNLGVDIELSADAIKNFCESLSITPLSLFQVAWGIVLRVYTDSDRVCFGYLSAGRDVDLLGIEDGVGPFLTMLICSLDLSGGKLSDLLQKITEDMIKCLPYQHCGLGNIQRALEMGNTPLFNTILSFHREETNSIATTKGSGIAIKSLSVQDPTEYALGIDIGLFKDTLEISLQFWTDHITPSQASNIASTFNKILSSILQSPDSDPTKLDLASQSQIQKMIHFNGDGAPLPTSNRLMFEHIVENARLRPDAEAICSWEGSWTYKQLDETTTRLGHHLRSLGVGPEIIVPHIFHKSAWAVISMLSILKAGGAVVGLDYTHPRHRLENLIAEVDAEIVCVSPATAGIIKGMTRVKYLVVVDEVFVRGLEDRRGVVCKDVRPYNLSHVVFSSGTTSKPKTIAIEHVSMSTMTDLLGPPFKISPSSRVFQFSAYAYDTSNHDIFVTLQRGGCICIPSEEERINDPAKAMRRMRVNWAALTPTVARLVTPEEVPDLKFISCGGEPLDRELVERWAGRVEMVNGYGPAETTVSSSLSAPLTPDSGSSNIGPSYGARAWIVDINDYNRLLPIGAAGELLLEGPQLARCYLKNRELTEKAFVFDPAWARKLTPGLKRRFYRTGDVCRFNCDGTLSIMGRRDTMVKINGQRVELEEVNFQLRSHLSRKATVVVDALPLQTSSRSLTLVAFMHYEDTKTSTAVLDDLILSADEELSLEHLNLQSILESRLPRYMVPSLFIPVTEIPHTRNGKLDRKRLHAAVLTLSEEQITTYSLQHLGKSAPETTAEITLQSLWSEVLRRPIETIGRNDDFFRAGGDSFGAMKLVAAARAKGLCITVPDMFKSPRLSDMALRLSTSSSDDSVASQAFDLLPRLEEGLEMMKDDVAEQCGVLSEDIVDIYPCTPLQEGLMALSTRLSKGVYKAQKVFRITDAAFDANHFKTAWDTVATSEPILRTRIVNTKAAGTMQAVLKKGIEWYETNEQLKVYLEHDLKSPITYGGPLLRFALVKNEEGYYFVWSAHHAAYDGWSANITLNQVQQALRGTKMVSKPIPFKNFIRHLTKTDVQAQSTFWTSQFPSDQTPPISFPLVPNGYTTLSHNTLKETLALKVKSPSGFNITTPTILRAAWASVTARYAGHQDIIFGATLSGRTANVAGVENMNGPTITTVPVRIRLDTLSGATIQEFLSTVQEQATDMTSFEHIGLQNIRKQSPAASGALDCISNLLVIQSSTSSSSASDNETGLKGLEAMETELEEFDNYPLVMLCSIHANDTVSLEVKYDSSLIPARQMQRIVRQFEYTLRQLCGTTTTLVKDLETINPEDINEIAKWNGPLPETEKACIHHVITTRKEEAPDSPAICAWDGQFTYAELESKSTLLAAHLQSLGVGSDVKVALCFEKSKWSIVAMLSVLKAGGTYTQLNPEASLAVKRGIIEDLGAEIFISSPLQTSAVEGIARETILLDEGFVHQLPTSMRAIRSDSRPDTPAFIVYTSGSTGKPKGVVVEHRGFSSMVRYQTPQLGITRTSRVLAFAAHWFDISNADVFMTLMKGGCVCVPSEEEKMSRLAEAINKYNVNWVTMVPTAAAVLKPEEVPTLKHLSLGGEPIRSDLHKRWSKRVTLMNSYGPAECSVLTTMGSLSPDVSPQNIGVGLGCRTWITEKDNHDRLVSVGCIGELCIEGPIVTRGYHNLPSITAESYISSPAFAKALGIENMRMYKTGDLVRYEANGTVHIIGRKDTQIKIRGRRIECGEVEHHIVGNGFDVDCVVVERIYEGGEEGKAVLAAFVRFPSSEEQEVGTELAISLSTEMRRRLEELRRKLHDFVQPYMVPTLFIALKNLPLTTTGKKDRKMLREIGAKLSPSQLQEYRLSDSISGSDGRACSTEMEFQLRALWAEALGLKEEDIFANDHFLQRGGDSISAIGLTSAARRVGKVLTVSDIFLYPRLHEMANCLSNNTTTSEEEEIEAFALITEKESMIEHAARECGVSKEKIQDIYPCTPLQEGLVAISTRVPDAYIATRVFDIPSSIDIPTFKHAWETAFRSFPILRTRVILSPEMESLQVVLDEPLIWNEINGSVKTYLKRYSLKQIEYGAPLSSYALSTRTRKFIWTTHHALYDGFSASKLLSFISLTYAGQYQQIPKSPNYNGFIRYLQNVDMVQSDVFWRGKLEGNPSSFPRLEGDYRPKMNREFVGGFEMKWRGEEGVMRASILRGAWGLVTARYMESNDIVYGEVLSGRNVPVPGVEDMIAPCFTTVPIRIQLDSQQSIGQYLTQIQDDAAAIIPFQHRGLQSLRRLGPEVHRALELNSLFEVHDGVSTPVDNLLVEIQDKDLIKDFFDSYALVLECIMLEDDIRIEIRYDDSVIPTWQVERLCGHLKQVAQQLCTIGHEKKVNEVEMFSAEDKMLLEGWNGRDDIQCLESSIPDIFAREVQLHPHATAISGWDGEMSYQELDQLSDLVAQNLVTRGIGREDIILMCFEKSKWAIVAMMGVIKAGAAVAQLGISHPIGRRREILQDTKAKLILSSRIQEASLQELAEVLVVDSETIHTLGQEGVKLPEVKPSDTAYILFTSGSTGRSKGIIVEHRNICTSSHHHGKTMGINPSTRVFQFSAYTFDISCADIFTSLQRGATICVPSEEERIHDLAGAITKYNADWIFLTPTVVQMLDPASVPTLKTLAIGGEAPTRENIETWSEKLRLVLIWGPAETTIYATSAPGVTRETSPTLLGAPMGCHVWLCEAEDKDKLTPVGCVGEIVVEGGLVSRGYLNNESQTKEAYFSNPTWARGEGERRMYRTGDLARWGEDGVLRYVGRKDRQVKLHGQRFELEDIEQRVLRHEGIRHVVARIPRSGPLKDKLVATIEHHRSSSEDIIDSRTTLSLLEGQALEAVETNISTIRQDLEETLPSYQCPTIWLSVSAIPLNMNGKIDRKAVGVWLEAMDQSTYELLFASSADTPDSLPSTREEQILQTLIGQVLNLQSPSPSRSFLSLGGDSITAMQLRAKARAEGLEISVQDIVKSKNLSALAVTAKSSLTAIARREEREKGTPFDLSPIQKLFFDTAKKSKQLNQSFVVRINAKINAGEMEAAIVKLVERHEMLRARFHLVNGKWRQVISEDIQGSFSLDVHDVQNRSQVGDILSAQDFDMDIGSGPLFISHIYNVGQGDEQLLFLSAHHLVIDTVSWRVILNDLQELLTKGSLSSQSPLAFRDWIQLQTEHVQSENLEESLFATSPDFNYWGMQDQSNVFADISTNELTLSSSLTEKIFGSTNSTLNTEPVDIILAAVIHAFQAVFTDRPAPAVLMEGHGRETWSEEVDPNGTVGWFTTMNPIQMTSSTSDIIQIVRGIKDLRRTIGNRVPYLSELFTAQKFGERLSKEITGMEILFNYLGKSQQLEVKDSFFSQVDLGDAVTTTQFAPEMERFSLIDISVVVAHDQAQISFTHNKKMRHQDKLHLWTQKFQDSITLATEALSSMGRQHTVSDFPLLTNLNEDSLAILEQRLAANDISMDNVQDIFPCAPLQQHMIDAQEQNQGSGLYEVNVYHQVTTARGPINITKMQEAWKKVVEYHAILRTVFIRSSSRSGRYDQAVLSSYSEDTPIITCTDEKDLLQRIKSYKSLDYNDHDRPHQRFTLFTTSDGRKTACKLEISHALIDGMSVSILFRDLAAAYRDSLTIRPGTEPYFGNYMAWLSRQTTDISVKYWRDMISSSAHSFTSSTQLQRSRREQKFLNVNLDPAIVGLIPSFCQQHGVTIATFFQTIWGIILQQCVTPPSDSSSSSSDSDSDTSNANAPPLFGYMVANRDAAVHSAENIVGPMTAMLLCRTDCRPTTRVGDLLHRTQNDLLEAMGHQSALDDAVKGLERENGEGKLKFCNSVMSLQYVDAGKGEGMGLKEKEGKRVKGLRIPAAVTGNGGEGKRIPLGENTSKRNTLLSPRNTATKPKPQLRQPIHRDQEKETDTNDLKFHLLGYHDPNEYDMSIGIQILRASASEPPSSRLQPNTTNNKNSHRLRDSNITQSQLQINIGFAYWTDVMRDAKARHVVRAFERCAEEMLGGGGGGLRVWMLRRRLG